MAEIIDRFKTVLLTEGGADAFVEGYVDTEIVPEDGYGWEITRLEYTFDAAQLAQVSADGYVHYSVTRDTKTGVVGVTDPDTIWSDGFAWSLTTSGMILLPVHRDADMPAGTVFVEPRMYFQLDSNATGLAMAVGVRVHYQLRKLSEVEILRLLQNS